MIIQSAFLDNNPFFLFPKRLGVVQKRFPSRKPIIPRVSHLKPRAMARIAYPYRIACPCPKYLHKRNMEV